MYKGRLGKYVPGENKEEDTGLKSGAEIWYAKRFFPDMKGIV